MVCGLVKAGYSTYIHDICISRYTTLTVMESALGLISRQVRSLTKCSGGISKDIVPTRRAFLKFEVSDNPEKLCVKCQRKTVWKWTQEVRGIEQKGERTQGHGHQCGGTKV